MIERPDYLKVAERLTKALITGDFELYARVVMLPMRINPVNDRPYVLRTMEALQTDFDLYHQANVVHHVTDIYRQVRAIRTIGDGAAAVDVWTELLSHAERIVDPFQATHHLRQTPEGWRIYQIDSTPGHINWTLRRAGISRDGKFTASESGG
jgi:hypothetical protein